MGRSSITWRKRLLALSLASIVVLVVGDVALSTFVLKDGLLRDRPLPPFGATPHPRQQEWVAARRLDVIADDRFEGWFDRELGWTNRRWAKGNLEGQHFNGIGARGKRETEPEPPPGQERVVCFGDSYTYGARVVDGDDWAAQLDAACEEYEVLNFGVQAYGTGQALMRFRRRREALAPDVVVIGILVENIGRNVNRYRPLYYPGSGSALAKPRFVLEDDELRLVPQPFADASELLDAISDGTVVSRVADHEYWTDASDLGVLERSSIARLVLGWRAYQRRQARALWSDTDGEPFRVTLAILETFHREALEGGASRAVVVVFPRQKELASFIDDGERYWQTLLDELERRGIPYVDTAEALREPFARTREDASLPRLYTGGHLSREGNHIVAERLREWLQSE